MDVAIERIIVFLINILGVWLAVWVYSANKREELNQWFAMMTFFVMMWVNSAFLGYGSHDTSFATSCYRLNFTFVALFIVAFYYFYIVHFFQERGRYLILAKVVALCGVIIAGLSFYTDLIIKNTYIREWGAEIEFGSLNGVFNLFSIIVSVIIIDYTVRRYIHFSKRQKIRLQYLSVGIFFFVLSNIVFNIFFPQILNTMEFGRFGDYSAMILLAFTAYAITKNNLMGVKTLLAQVIIIIMSIVLMIDILFLSNNPSMQLIKSGILVTFLYYSRELVRSVKREKEITEKIEKANLNLAERNRDLHILFEANGQVSQDLDSKKISQDVVNNIPKDLKYLGYTFGVIALYSIKKDCLYVYAVTDSAAMRDMEKRAKIDIRKFREHLSTHDDSIIRTIKEKQIHVSDKMEDFFGGFMGEEKSMEVQKILKVRSFISVPLYSSGQVMGAIIFANERRKDYITERSKDIVSAFCSHIGSSIENAQLYEKTNSQMKELAKLNRNLKTANIKLEELLEMKTEFLHITSHQLRTPLTAIRGMISMWVAGDFDKMKPAQKKEMLERIYVSTERLNNITNDMLDALEWEGGVLRLDFKKVSIVEMMKDTIATLMPDYEKKGLYLRLKAEGEIPEAEVEPNYMSQVFMNLVDNACKYTRNGGTEIKISNRGKYIDVEIADTGIGIDAKEQKKIFDKFTRGKEAMVENASGSGLGLFIVKKILDEHGSRISIESAPGKGTTFKISVLKKQE